MKKWVCIILAVLFLSFSVSAQTVSTSELKTTLIDSIKDYLTSQTPKLEKDELKDLIVVYLTAPGDVVDLSKTGTYSGKKLIDIYNKAKGTTCTPSCVGKCGGVSNGCGGTCDELCGSCVGSVEKLVNGAWAYVDETAACKPKQCGNYDSCAIYPKVKQDCTTGYCCRGECEDVLNFNELVKTAVKLNKPVAYNADMYGYFEKPPGGAGEYTIPKDAEVWFLVDPKGFGVLSTPCLKMEFRDYQQGGNLYIQMYILDQNDNLVNPATLGFSMNPILVPLDHNSINFGWLCNKHKDSQKYLIKITETRGNSTPYNIAWWFG